MARGRALASIVFTCYVLYRYQPRNRRAVMNELEVACQYFSKQNLLTYDDGCRCLLTTAGFAWVGPSGSTR